MPRTGHTIWIGCSQMYMIVPLTIYVLERLVRMVLPHVRNTELVDVKLMGGNEKVGLWAAKFSRMISSVWRVQTGMTRTVSRAVYRGRMHSVSLRPPHR